MRHTILATPAHVRCGAMAAPAQTRHNAAAKPKVIIAPSNWLHFGMQ